LHSAAAAKLVVCGWSLASGEHVQMQLGCLDNNWRCHDMVRPTSQEGKAVKLLVWC
jgi:hypothetical protein